MAEHTKGELRLNESVHWQLVLDVKGEPVVLAEMADNEEPLTDWQQLVNAKRLILCWNSHDDLLAALEFYADEANSVELVSGRRNILTDNGKIAKAALKTGGK